MEIKKSGMIFTYDGIIAAILLMVAVSIISSYFIVEENTAQAEYVSFDSISFLSDITMSELNASELEYYMNQSNVTYEDNTILEQIGFYWVKNQTNLSKSLSETIMSKYIPERYGFKVLVAGEEIFSRNATKKTSLVSTKQMVSGIEKFKPLRGSTGRVFLTGIGGKFVSSYMYFGGFIGQGNISKRLLDIPSDANLTDMYMELDAGEAFRLYINTVQCDGPASDDTFVPDTGNMTSDGWDISACKSLINEGSPNDFTFEFNSSVMDYSYIGGGYIRVGYKTSQLGKTDYENYTRIYLPTIDGIINLYSSFYVPGNITNLAINLHYYANNSINETVNNTFYLKIGDTTVYSDQNTTTKTVLLNNATLGSILNYSLMAEENIPFRLGFENLSYNEIYEGNSDVVVITDISGSMDWRMDNNNMGTPRNCDNNNLNLSSTSRISIAKCLDKQFHRDIINITGNKVGLVAYEGSTHASETVVPTTDQILLDDTIGIADPEDGYNANGGTCICCGINSAIALLSQNLLATTIVRRNSTWLYNNFSLTTPPPLDVMGREWYELEYANEASWHSGQAILGATNSHVYSPGVDTEMGYDLSSTAVYMDLWENSGDIVGPPADFGSGLLNYTANTYGIGGADDGWDWDSVDGSGPFGFDDNFDYNEVINGRLHLDNQYDSGSSRNVCDDYDCSGAYGILIDITAADYAIVSAGGTARVSFDWQWEDFSGNQFETSQDQAWVKAQWVSPTSGAHYLGEALDSSHYPRDSDMEVASIDNPNVDAWGVFYQDVGGWIEGPGQYYLELGGKIQATYNNEIGSWSFDNIAVEIAEPDRYYFRKHFTLSSTTNPVYADLWEHSLDNPGPPLDFTGNTLNTTGNTYGIGGADDGWDWDSVDDNGPFGFDDNFDYNEVINGRLHLDNQYDSGSSRNVCDDYDCSGSYGVLINITDDLYGNLSLKGGAFVSFYYEWVPGSTSDYEDNDQVWVKARWTSPYTGSRDLGKVLDSGHTGADSSIEIFTADNPDDAFSGNAMVPIGSFIEGPGYYYLELGGKLRASEFSEWGEWRFDDIQLSIQETSLALAQRGIINLLSDDRAVVYVNGNLITEEPAGHEAQYWNSRGKHVSGDYFRDGDNVVAVELSNVDDAAKFDLELIVYNDSRQKAMMVMTDGQANVECSAQGTGDARDDAILAACKAREDWGITSYAVGYSDEAEMYTVMGVAQCGDGLWARSSNISALQEFYADVAYGIISSSRRSQVIELEGSGGNSNLFWDSYIDINYTPTYSVNKFGKIFLNYESDQFSTCSESVYIPDDLVVTEAAVKSYSSEHWTDNVTVNSNQVFLLSDYGEEYALLGDPFKVEIPPTLISSGSANMITISTGDSLTSKYNCSPNNTLIYGGYADMQFAFEDVMEIAEGCNWTIEYEGGTNVELKIPDTYTGARDCNYTNASVDYNPSDIYDVMIYSLLDKLDLDNDKRLDINLNESLLNINILEINEVPYMWGPTMVEVQVWQ